MSEDAALSDAIIRFTRGRRYRPMTAEELAAELGVAADQRDMFRRTVEDLMLAGELVEVKNRCLADPARVDLMVGTLDCNPRGFGFIRPARAADGEDVYVIGENMSSALHGDLVVARVPPAYRKAQAQGVRGRRRPEADVKVVSVLKRARTDIVGTFRCDQNVRYVVPDNPRLYRDVIVAPEDANGARPNDKVRVAIAVWPTRHMNPGGRVVEVLGPRGDLEAERLSVIREYNLRDDFPPEVRRQARRIPLDPRPADLRGREDLTGEMIFTIDPIDARDFDDAVSLAARAEGGWVLGVHIADVSHYVHAGDPIDVEAERRGTSVYLPGQVIPMLPEALSNEACSLKPGVLRLTKTVEMRVSPEGLVESARIFHSFIRSVRRFTYEEAQAVIKGGRLAIEEAAVEDKILEMHDAAECLRRRRRERGMLEFAIPEPHILTDEQGRTTGVELLRSDESHRLIEQFMLAANEAVAEHLMANRLPYLCRAHDEPEPESLREFREVARSLNHSFPSPGTRHQMQRFLDRLRGAKDEALMHYLLLRAMKQAEYSAEERGHYAIAARHYLHFTSPIRRYPDLLAHRILDEEASGRMNDAGRRAWWRDRLPAWTTHATETERNAEEAERVLTRRRMVEFIAARRGSLDALVVSVENYGMRVQLRDSLLEGVVHMSALRDGFYSVDRRVGALVASSRKRYRIGDLIKVRVLRYDDLKHQIEFEPVPSRR